MTKDDFITRLDALVSDPEHILQNAMSLRQDVCADYDNFESQSTAYSTLKDNYTAQAQQINELKDLNLRLFMAQPSVGGNPTPPTDPPTEPEGDPVPPAKSSDEQINDLLGDIRAQLK